MNAMNSTTTADLPVKEARGSFAPMQWVGDAVSGFMNALSAAYEAQRLIEMTDEQLAERGMKREDIPQLLFQRLR